LTYKRLGYIPVAIPYAEAYSAIETGIADGQMGGPPFQGHEFRDIQGAWIQYNDFVETHWFMMNRKLFSGLTKGDQKILVDAAERQGVKQWGVVEAQDEEYRKKMADRGLKIVLLSEPELEKIAKAIRTDVWPELDKIVGKALMDIARKNVGMPLK
jgi:TRAP-type C4-dicarboxylate transport system substrate-binding protein